MDRFYIAVLPSWNVTRRASLLLRRARASLYLAKTHLVAGIQLITKLFRIAGNGRGRSIRYRSSGFRRGEGVEGWVCTIVENECRATRNFQLGLKGLVRDSLASAFTATPLNSLVTVH